MRFVVYIAVAFATFAVSSLAQDLYRSHHRPAPSVSTPDPLPPWGWTESCESAALGPVCHTYPPWDRSWEPTRPLPPYPPLRLPSK